MNLSEKVQYLSGLMDGLGIDDSTDTGKVLLAMKDILEEVCEAVDGIDSDVDDIVDFCNAMDEDLHNVEEAVFDEAHHEPPHCPHPHHEPHGDPHHPHHPEHCCHHHGHPDRPPMGEHPYFDDDDDFMFDLDDDLLPPLWDGKDEGEDPDFPDESEPDAGEIPEDDAEGKTEE